MLMHTMLMLMLTMMMLMMMVMLMMMMMKRGTMMMLTSRLERSAAQLTDISFEDMQVLGQIPYHNHLACWMEFK